MTQLERRLYRRARDALGKARHSGAGWSWHGQRADSARDVSVVSRGSPLVPSACGARSSLASHLQRRTGSWSHQKEQLSFHSRPAFAKQLPLHRCARVRATCSPVSPAYTGRTTALCNSGPSHCSLSSRQGRTLKRTPARWAFNAPACWHAVARASRGRHTAGPVRAAFTDTSGRFPRSQWTRRDTCRHAVHAL